MPAKNFLMFSIDDLRAVEHWGHFTPLIETPNLDRLAAMGTTFERAVTQVPLCNPARTSVLTGTQPSRTGVLDNDVPWFERVNPADTLPAVLKAAGVHVAMYGKHFHTHALTTQQEATMFDRYLPPPTTSGVRAQVIEDDVQHDSPFASGRYGGTASTLPDEQTAAAAVDFLRNVAPGMAQPFFLGVGIYKPHLDWWAPSRFFDLYSQAEIRAALRDSLADGTIIPGDGEYFDVPSMSAPSPEHALIRGDMDLWVDYIHAYLAAISYADAKVGQVLDALAANPALARDTAILLWSDHGYHLGDKDRWGKFDHWKEATQVPFILVDPDADGGRTAEQIVSLVDIFPTVLDTMGIAAPSRLGLSGNSLQPILRDVDTDWYDPGAGKGVALTTVYGSFSVRAHVPGSGDFRYTRYPDGTQELYDITRDPDEHVNRLNPQTGAGLTAADNATRTLMRGLLDQEMAKAGVLMSDGVRSTVGTVRDELLVSTNGPGVNALAGGGGDDVYVLYRAATITEASGGGTDLVVFRNTALEASYALPANVEDVQVQTNFTANSGNNRIFGSGPANVLNGAAGNDQIFGFGGADRLIGGSGRDLLRGFGNNDTLVGGPGADRLEGGSGADVFDINATSESSQSSPDVVLGFDRPGAGAGDRIDLSTIDANTTVAGNQAFVFGGTGVGRLRVVNNGQNSEVLGNVDRDVEPELRIVIEDGNATAAAYTAADFAL